MAESETDDSKKMFGPLTFENSKFYDQSETELEIPCLGCENTFNTAIRLDIFLKHLLEVHNIVIEDIQNIKYLSRYIQHWKDRFRESPMEEIIPSIRIDSTSNLYFVFSTLLKEDKELRHKLELEYVLKVQEFERTDTNYKKPCLYCRQTLEGTRPDFVNHLVNQHNLHLGNPQNLVFIEELIDKVEEKLDNLICLYCKRIFPERTVLKEHMRKKLHKRINQCDRSFDKYYIINYLEANKNWRAIEKEDDTYAISRTGGEANSDEDYSDWNDRADLITCLFCEKRESNINTLCLHMDADHEFDFVESTADFDFYQKVKGVNYIRKQIHFKKCVYCDIAFENLKNLEQHMLQEGHCRLPKLCVFDKLEYYFPTYEDDAFLYQIEDVED